MTHLCVFELLTLHHFYLEIFKKIYAVCFISTTAQTDRLAGQGGNKMDSGFSYIFVFDSLKNTSKLKHSKGFQEHRTMQTVNKIIWFCKRGLTATFVAELDTIYIFWLGTTVLTAAQVRGGQRSLRQWTSPDTHMQLVHSSTCQCSSE